MQKVIVKRYVYAAGMFVLITIAGLWAWNTLSELFGGPQAQYRHVLAAFFMLLILQWGLGGCRFRSGNTCQHEHQ